LFPGFFVPVTGEGLEPSTNGLTFNIGPVLSSDDRRRQGTTEHARTAVNQGIERSTTSERSIPCSRTDTTENDAERPPVTPEFTPSHCVVVPDSLPDDLQSIVDAWDDVDAALRPGIVAMILAAAERGGWKVKSSSKLNSGLKKSD
jgi:hypothetical protein